MLRLENQIREMPSMTAVDSRGAATSPLQLVAHSPTTLELVPTPLDVSSSDILEYKIYCQTFSQLGGQLLSISGGIPDAALRAVLTLCHVRTTHVEAFLSSSTENIIRSKKGRSRPQETKRAIKDFGRSVKMLRDIIMEYAAIHT